jgi:hypothetical protein
MKKTIIPIAALALIILGGLDYIAHWQTCAADNQAYQSVIKDWGKTNVTDLSRVLTRMQSDNCKIGGGA